MFYALNWPTCVCLGNRSVVCLLYCTFDAHICSAVHFCPKTQYLSFSILFTTEHTNLLRSMEINDQPGASMSQHHHVPVPPNLTIRHLHSFICMIRHRMYSQHFVSYLLLFSSISNSKVDWTALSFKKLLNYTGRFQLQFAR